MDSGKPADKWYLVDARGFVLGRLASRIARVLIGKDKPTYVPNLDSGDHVVVVNAEQVILRGRKLEEKVYRRHSGYPGGLKEIPAARLKERKPEAMLREAVLGMLPKNKLRARMAKKLRIYVGEQHPHTAQKPEPLKWAS